MTAPMLRLFLLIQLLAAATVERARRVREDPERGEIVQTVVIISLFVAAAIVIVAILVTKATDAANGVTTQ